MTGRGRGQGRGRGRTTRSSSKRPSTPKKQQQKHPSSESKPAGQKKKKQKNQQRTITDCSDAALETLLAELRSQNEPEETFDSYRKVLFAKVQSLPYAEFAECHRLGGWMQKFTSEATQSDERPRLGSMIPTLGLGSLTGTTEENKKKVDDFITSIGEDDDDRKGCMLSHFFYRRFLHYIYNGFEAHVPEEEAEVENHQDLYSHDEGRKKFKENYDLIWTNTNTGVVKSKRTDGNTHEPCATSLLGAYINHAISSAMIGSGYKESSPVWCSEYTLLGSGAPEAGRNAANPASQRKGQQPDEGNKQPRCDGLLVTPDPLKNQCLRALVMMEAKMNAFSIMDDYQTRSNAADAFSRQPNGEDAWPLLVFRCTINNKTCAVEVSAVVPTSERKARLVPMWGTDTESSTADPLYNAVMASVLAANDFREELEKTKEQLRFCMVGRNVAIDDQGANPRVFKSFFRTDRRKANLNMIREYDDTAKEIRLGGVGSYVEMKYLGPALPEDVQIDIFVKIGGRLSASHLKNICHGDVRIDNLLLASGDLIDWDLAGIEGEQKYPETLQDITDGKRHPDVRDAISNKRISEVTLQKAHDWYSLKAAMKLFRPKEDQNRDAWSALIEGIEDESVRNRARSTFVVILDNDQVKNRGQGHRITQVDV